MENKLRIVVDTNIWISFLITKHFSHLDEFFKSDSVKLIFDEKLLEEFIEVVSRTKFKKYFSAKDIDFLMEFINENSDFVVTKTKTNVCRDAKDNFLLSLAKDGDADFLITGDLDLLELKIFENTKIVTLKYFAENN